MTLHWLAHEIVERLVAEETTAYRMAWGDAGLAVDRFGAAALISSPVALDAKTGDFFIEAVRRHEPRITTIYFRRLIHAPKASDVPKKILSTPETTHRFEIMESGLRYEVDFSAGYSCGFFPDQRNNRIYLRDLKPGRLLNTYAFTCAFSVAAASVGAATLSVDLARQILERGKHNFALNSLSSTEHRFYADDTFAVLARLARRGETFDAIILDPPTFSRNRQGEVFRAERDMGRLLAASLPCLEKGGSILLSTNCSSHDTRTLTSIAHSACSPRKVKITPPQEDFTPATAPATIWMTI